VVLQGGTLVAHLDLRAHHLRTTAGPGGPPDATDWVGVLADLVARAPRRRLEIQRVNGVPVRSTPLGAALDAVGFVPTPRGVVLRG
jgi:ATP-dependent Lhr-like helicase